MGRQCDFSRPSLFLMGMQKVYPVSIHTTVNAYLLPFDEGGGIHQLIPYLRIPSVVLLVQIFVFQIEFFFNFLYHTYLTIFAVLIGTVYCNYHCPALIIIFIFSRSSPEDPVTLKSGVHMSYTDLCMPSQALQ